MVETIPEWETVHSYLKLIEIDEADDFVCPSCEKPAALMLGKDDLPALKCYWCGVLTHPGQGWYDRLQHVVKEFYNG